MSTTNPYPIRSIRAVAVLEVKYCHGEGTVEDPCREVTEYWTQGNTTRGGGVGNLLARFDGQEPPAP